MANLLLNTWLQFCLRRYLYQIVNPGVRIEDRYAYSG